ncbi:MAG: hypothetical protein SWK76_02190 [Actinomycetota bacterium]|nr:hypothetical protein [Actinomycetota bacterium]
MSPVNPGRRGRLHRVPGLDCVWILPEKEVEARGVDIEALKELETIHKKRTLKRMPTHQKEKAPLPLMRLAP